MSENKKQRNTSSKKKPLTHGWIVVPSKTYPDRVYFYNTITQCSTWKNPCEDLSASEQSSSESSSPKKKRSGKYKSRSLSSKKLSKKRCDSEESTTKRNDEIVNYDEDQDQYFNNLIFSNLPAGSPMSSPDSATTSKRDSGRSPNCDLTSNEEKKELWLHFATISEKFKKSVAMSDFNPPSTSKRDTDMEKRGKSSQVKEKLSPRSRFSVYEQSSKTESEKVNTRKRKRKNKRTYSFSEDCRKTEDKIINNVSSKKRDKTPAQTCLLKLRQKNAEMLKKLADSHSSVLNLNINEPHTPSTSRQPSIDNLPKNSEVINSDSTEKENDFNEEMDWEASSEELDVQSINEFREKSDKLNSNDTLFELTMDKLPSLPSETDTWILVLDTNIFVSCLSFIKELRDTNVPELGYPILYIPWRVLKELDHLKETNFDFNDRPLNYNVRRSINYLNETFKSRHPRCFGQSYNEFTAMVDGENNAPDDEILQTCIQLQKLYPTKKLTLLTNDKNLESKAIISNVEAYSKEGLQKKYLSSIFAPNRNGMARCPSIDVNQLDNAVCGVKNLLKNLIPKVVEAEMKTAFQGDWIKLAYKKPPWTLQDAMDCLIRHWRSVFFLVFPKEALFEIENLYQKLFSKEPASLEEIKELINTILKIINLFGKSQEKDLSYSEMLETSKVKLLDLLNGLSSKKGDCGATSSREDPTNTPKESNFFGQEKSCENDVQLAKNLFKEIWDALRSFCCLVSDVLNSSGTSNASIPEIRLKLTQVLNEMNELLIISDELFKVSVKEVSESHPLIIHLSNFLIKICPTLAEKVVERLPVCLAAFLTDSEGRSLLNRSLVDFREFSQDLIKANEYFEKTYPTF